MSKKRRLNINLPAEEHSFLRRLADVYGLTMTKLIRRWIGREGGPYMEDANSRFKLTKDIKPLPDSPEGLCSLIGNILKEHSHVEEITVKSGKPVSFSFWVDKDNYNAPDLSIYSMLRKYHIEDLTPQIGDKTPYQIIDYMIDSVFLANCEPLCFIVNGFDIWSWTSSSCTLSRRKSRFLGYPVLQEPSIGDDRILLAASPKKELGVGSASFAVQVAVDQEDDNGDDGKDSE